MNEAKFKVGDRVVSKAATISRLLHMHAEGQPATVENMEWAKDGDGWGYIIRYDNGSPDYCFERELYLVIEEKR